MPSKPTFLTDEFTQKLNYLPMMQNSFSLTSFGFHEERLSILDPTNDNSPDAFRVLPSEMQGVHPDAEVPHTYLQIAAMIGDVLLLCEMIRIGAIIDIQDRKGSTALSMVLESLVTCQAAIALGLPGPDPKTSGIKRLKKLSVSDIRLSAVQRFTFIARTLIEQHADVNHTVNGLTPLHLACKAEDWDIIILLLQHGANPNPTPQSQKFPSPQSLLTTNNDRTRFSTLVSKYSTGRTRPPRKCPCLSGLAIAACHAVASVPYPPSILCRCASGKSFQRCCARRKMEVTECWDSEREEIVVFQHNRIPMPGAAGVSKDQQEKVNKNIQTLMETQEVYEMLRKEMGMPSGVESAWDTAIAQKLQMTDELLTKGLIDPAFAYALKALDFVPRPLGRRHRKRDCQENQERWNAAVDSYISQGKDMRTRVEIEQAAKIGLSGGALYRHCEGIGCNKIEGRNIEKLKPCSRCKMSVYCGRSCQTSAWRSHKAVCGDEEQLAQGLPSQDACDSHLADKIPEMMKRMGNMNLTPPPEIQAMLDAKRASRV